jgi:hypothetical protein
MSNDGCHILFVLGFSGAGKSHFARYAADRLAWLHIELDQPGVAPQQILGDGPLMQGYRRFAGTLEASAFIDALRDAGRAAGKSGVVVSFRSVDYIPAATIAHLRHAGVATVYLVGDARFCLRAFMQRERAGGEYSPEDWTTNNGALIRRLSEPEMDPYAIPTFDPAGGRVPVQVLFAALGDALLTPS